MQPTLQTHTTQAKRGEQGPKITAPFHVPLAYKMNARLLHEAVHCSVHAHRGRGLVKFGVHGDISVFPAALRRPLHFRGKLWGGAVGEGEPGGRGGGRERGGRWVSGSA